MKNHKKGIRSDENGLAAVVITVFVMVILSLIVLAFSQIARREQRQALDRQLSTQAFYVAESGINDAVKFLRDPVSATYPSEKESCKDPDFPAALGLGGQLDSGGTLQESCVLFDRQPTSVEYSSVNEYRGELVSLKTTAGTPSSITLEWHKESGGSNFSGCTAPANILNLPTQSSYTNCDAGVLRVTLMPVVAGFINREQLVKSSYTAYLRPVSGAVGSTHSYNSHGAGAAGADTQGLILPADCTSGGVCRATINGIPASSGLFLKVNSIYSNSALSIKGTDSAGSAKFVDAQAKIDSTGKVSDVVKRLQVRVPLRDSFTTTPYALESVSGICKLLDVYPGYANNNCSGGLD